MGTSIRVENRSFATEAERAHKEQKDRLNEEAKLYWGDPSWMKDMATVVTETILQSFEFENLLQLFTVLENVGEFDRVTVSEVRGLRCFWYARGGYIQASSMQRDTVEMERDIVGFHVFEETDKLRANFAESQGDLISLGARRMEAAVNQRVLALFQEAVPNGSDFYTSHAGLQLTTLDQDLDEVFDQTEDGAVNIIARRPMTGQIITQLLGNSMFTPETNEEMIRTGLLGVYRGARIIQLKNYKDDLEIPFFPANELWVVGRDASKCAFWGGVASKEYEEDDDWYWHFIAKREFGGMVHRPNRLRRIVDSAISPTQGSGGSYAAA